MHLHYHKNNFYWFKGLNVKRITNMIPKFKISNELVTNMENGDKRHLILYDNEIFFLVNLFISRNLNKFLNIYKENNNNNDELFPLNPKFPLSVSCLSENDIDGLKLHCDTSNVNTTDLPRYFGCNIYLNNNYDGGELIFPFMDLKIKPESGDLIAYKSNIEFPHYVKKVTKGYKWLLQGYFRQKTEYD